MGLRPVTTRWFEVLTARDDVTLAVETLARTGAVELETHREAATRATLPDLRGRLEEFGRLDQRYHRYWPEEELLPSTLPGAQARALGEALGRLHGWAAEADPLIGRLEALESERAELDLLVELLEHSPTPDLDLHFLATAGPVLAARLMVLPTGAPLPQVSTRALHTHVRTPRHEFLLVVGAPSDVAALEQEVAALKGRRADLPRRLLSPPSAARQGLEHRLTEINEAADGIRQSITRLQDKHDIRQAIGDIVRLDWFMTHVHELPVSDNFAWITGWTSDAGGRRLEAALRRVGVRALLRFPPPPTNLSPPMVLDNPPWARPFELFARLLGTPARHEADPSALLAVIAPLLFGYMFGDVGQGFVLFLVGLALRRRVPALGLLVPGGISAMVFGVLFGSVFSREDLLPALWLHPIADPLLVLAVPLIGGAAILLLGLVLNGLEAYWRAAFTAWWQTEAPILVVYLGLLASVLDAAALWVCGAGLAWYLAGCAWRGRERMLVAVAVAAAQFLEKVLQLVVNTVSFARVGAFALAHTGLSAAIFGLAEAVGEPIGALVILLGNALVIILEGLVVSVQTTRLVLFEFFIRFLRGEGRVFRPLPAPLRPLAETGRNA